MRDSFCRTCGEAIGAADRFCGKCGRRIVGPESAEQSSSEAKLDSGLPAVNGPHHCGAKGWLRLFSILLFLSGLSLFRILRAYSAAKSVFAIYPAFEWAVLLEAFLCSVVMCYGIVVGTRILRCRPSGKRDAIRYLWLRLIAALAVAIGYELGIANWPQGEAVRGIAEINAAFLVEFLFFAIWMLYFRYSKRVRDTFRIQ